MPTSLRPDVTPSDDIRAAAREVPASSFLKHIIFQPRGEYITDFSLQVKQVCILPPLPSERICGCVSSRKSPTWNLKPVKLFFLFFFFYVIVVTSWLLHRSEGCKGRKSGRGCEKGQQRCQTGFKHQMRFLYQSRSLEKENSEAKPKLAKLLLHLH